MKEPFLALIVPVAVTPGAHPEHPIVIPPEQPPEVTPPPGGEKPPISGKPPYPAHPIILPGLPTHPIYIPAPPGAHPEHPIYYPEPPTEPPVTEPPPDEKPPVSVFPGLPIHLPAQDPNGGWIYCYVPGYGWIWVQTVAPEAPDQAPPDTSSDAPHPAHPIATPKK